MTYPSEPMKQKGGAMSDDRSDEMTGIVEGLQLMHIGIARKSGRYPWGSGKNPFQRSQAFQGYVDKLRADGLTDTEIADAVQAYANSGDGPKVSFRTTDLRAATAISTEQIYAENRALALRLKNAPGREMSTSAIARQMGVNESTVRGWLKQSEESRANSLRATAERLKSHLADKPYLDVGKGTELYMGVSGTKLNTALAMLRDEGYETHAVKVPQLGTGKLTEYKILVPPGVSWKEAYDAAARGEVMNVTEYSTDNGQTWKSPSMDPTSVSSKRIEVRYGDKGGAEMDGVIELRRGVPDLDLGASNYAQVRVAVDGTHYLKGMAMYADDLPAGVDIRFNTNKKEADVSGKLDAMKPMKVDKNTGEIDATNPFGATVRPKVYTDKNGKEKTSALNIVNEEGRWDEWSKSLSSQMLSKQPLALASQQLRKAQAKRKAEFDEIMSLTNPVVRRKFLEDFAENADAAAVHLKAAAMDRQSTHVILPMNSMRPNEIYAPNFENGEKVALVRYPHGGPFEIPELTVNNKNTTARRILGGATDAVGIHHTVAEQLSGADFDGDTVLVIPNDSGKIKSRPPLAGLKNFDPKDIYKIPDDDTTTRRMTKATTQTEMGKISNLITDMTIKGANDDELARAVRHSMVVIDAEKHGLNYKQSEIDNKIKELKETYQGKGNAGASTIISRASSDARVPERKRVSGDKGVDPVTGEKVFKETGNSYVDANGRTVMRTTKGTKMEFAKDARTLMSKDPEPMEELYASHANMMKDLGNQARLAAIQINSPKQSAAAKAVYADEVASLDRKLREALMNAPLERRAQILGNSWAKARIDAHPELDKDDIKKIQYQSLEDARIATGANKRRLGSDDAPITPREWEAIQAGAVSSTRLREILANADMTKVRELATPRGSTSLTPGQLAVIKALKAAKKSPTEIADRLGIPRSTVVDQLGD